MLASTTGPWDRVGNGVRDGLKHHPRDVGGTVRLRNQLLRLATFLGLREPAFAGAGRAARRGVGRDEIAEFGMSVAAVIDQEGDHGPHAFDVASDR